MSKSLNSHNVSGYLARDPKVFDNDDGNRSAILRVAVNGSKKVDGQWVDDPIFYDVKVYGAQVDAIETWLSKGSFVIVEGRGSHPSLWTPDDGETRATPVIVAKSVVFGPRTDGAGESSQPRQAAQQKAAAPAVAPLSAGDFADNDIPF